MKDPNGNEQRGREVLPFTDSVRSTTVLRNDLLSGEPCGKLVVDAAKVAIGHDHHMAR